MKARIRVSPRRHLQHQYDGAGAPRAVPRGRITLPRVGSRTLSPEAVAVLTPDRPYLPAILLVLGVFALRLSSAALIRFMLHH